MHFRLFAFLAIITMPCGTAGAADRIDPERLRHHVEILASDDFSGREAGGPADAKTTTYIAAAFARAGLTPAAGGEKWLQPVPLVRSQAVSAQLAVLPKWGVPLKIPPASIALIGAQATARIKDAPVIFIGYGLTDPRTGRDDLAGMNLTGTVLLRIAGLPPEYNRTGVIAPGFAERRSLYRARGAIAEISISDANDRQFRKVQSGYRRGLVQLSGDEGRLLITGQIRQEAATPILTGTGVSFDELKRRSIAPGFRPLATGALMTADVRSRIDHFQSANVVGKLAGADASPEAVLLTAHWDGYGICAGGPFRDRICNGAIDNASGVAGLIELAHALVQGPQPKRTILFIATTAEEYGLLGAEYYARHPILPLTGMIGGINLDTIALRGKGAKIRIIGEGLTSLDPVIREAAQEQGRSVEPDADVQQYYTRSDQYAFAKRGVPMVMATGLFSKESAKGDLLDRYFSTYYHKTGDELAIIPSFDGAAEDVELVLKVIREIANRPVRPAWLKNSPYQRPSAP